MKQSENSSNTILLLFRQSHITFVLATALLLTAGLSAAEPGQKILSHDFQTNPEKDGWQLKQRITWRGPQPLIGKWVSTEDKQHPASLQINSGYWQSPEFKVLPHHYYRLTFQSKADLPGYWSAVFYTADGKQLLADNNQGIASSRDWVNNECYFQGKADAATARLWFFPVEPLQDKSVYIRNIALTKATPRQVLSWADRLYATLPEVEYSVPADRWQLIPKTMKKLREGKPLRIVLLGDSIANDTGNAPLDLLIQRLYPKSSVTEITSIRGGTGCCYYQRHNRVEEYVVSHKPDLVIITGISHKHDLKSIRNVIRQIRRQSSAEIILTTGAITPDQQMLAGMVKRQRIPLEEAKKIRQAFLQDIRKMVKEERVEFIPLRQLWNNYVASHREKYNASWFMRDIVHANNRGAQALVRFYEQYFKPERRNERSNN